YDFRMREESASMGRWMQLDPMQYAAGDPNLYRTEGNSPIGRLDPTGLQDPEWSWRGCFGGWIGFPGGFAGCYGGGYFIPERPPGARAGYGAPSLGSGAFGPGLGFVGAPPGRGAPGTSPRPGVPGGGRPVTPTQAPPGAPPMDWVNPAGWIFLGS